MVMTLQVEAGINIYTTIVKTAFQNYCSSVEKLDEVH